jgi:hypothetical protein
VESGRAEDRSEGRQCWYEYWDRSLWTAGDLLSRINYVHGNPVKHGYVDEAAEWPWSSLGEYLAREEWQQLRPQLERFPAPNKLPGDDF